MRIAVGLLLAWCLASCKGLPTGTKDDEVAEIFHGAKRDTADTPPVSEDIPLLKLPLFSPLYNPLLNPYGGVAPPMMTPTDFIFSKMAAKGALGLGGLGLAGLGGVAGDPTAPGAANPLLISAFFKAKKDAFLAKLYEQMTATPAPDDGSVKRQAPAADSPAALPPAPAAFPPGFFLAKKFDFLNKLFTAINSTTPATPVETEVEEDDEDEVTTTAKPTIVPLDFWFPFVKPPKPPKAPKPPKPSKAPKPPKPPKAKEILKDALDTILLQSLLVDLGVDPNNATAQRRFAPTPAPAPAKKVKTKKPAKPAKVEEITEYRIPPKVDPETYSAKASDYLDKLFKSLNKTAEDEVTGAFIEPKATVVPLNFWTAPKDTEYTSKLDAFLDLLGKSLSATQSKTVKKRATFLDELLHRVPPSTTPTPDEPTTDGTASEEAKMCKECSMMQDGKEVKTDEKRSMLFRPFGPGYWLPSYLYASRMGLYMDALNNAAAANAYGAAGDEFAGLGMKRAAVTEPTKDNALDLILSELAELKDGFVEAFADGVKASKPAPKPLSPAAKLKKPIWGPKPTPTPDPVAPIQKRIDLLNDVFDKLVQVEKTLLLAIDSGAEPTDPKLIKNITSILEADTTKAPAAAGPPAKATIVPPSFWAPDETASADPNYYITKTQAFLQKLFDSKTADDSDEE